MDSGYGWRWLCATAAAVAIFRLKASMLTTLAACCAAGIGLHLAGVV
jgi:chromate transporter